jgi:hypothetical protein
MTEDELASLPVSFGLTTAARALAIGRNQSYRMVRDGTFPVPVRENNGRLTVSKYDVLAYLHVPGYYEPERAVEQAAAS